MTYEDKKKYLENFITLDAQIDALIKEKEKWYKRALILKNEDAVFATDVDSCKFALNKVMQIEKEITQSIDKLVDMRSEITDALEKIDDFILKQIIYYKYIKGMSFEKIGEEIGYCTKQISRLHKKAIESIKF